jgi:hypothetical protein
VEGQRDRTNGTNGSVNDRRKNDETEELTPLKAFDDPKRKKNRRRKCELCALGMEWVNDLQHSAVLVGDLSVIPGVRN